MKPIRNIRLLSIVIVCCLLGAWSIGDRLQKSLPRSGTWDFPIFVSYAAQFLATGQLYDRNLDAYAPNAAVYKFPPLSGSMLVTALKAGITATELKKAGAVLQMAGFFGGIFWLALVLMPERRLAACALALCLTSAMLPTLEENLLRLQLEPALLFLSIAAAIGVYNNKYSLAGFMIGIAVMLKIYPVMALLFFVVSRKWSAGYGFVAAIVLTSLFTLLTLGYAEHDFYVSSVLPILLQENPITDAENISIGRLLLLTNMDITYLKILLKMILIAPLAVAYTLIQSSARVRDEPARRQINTLIFSMFIPFTLAGMNNALWNYQLLLALPLTVLVCLLVNSWLVLKNQLDYWSITGLLFILASLHLTASMTVDDRFYSAELIHAIVALVDRILTPAVVVAVAWNSIRFIVKQKSPHHC